MAARVVGGRRFEQGIQQCTSQSNTTAQLLLSAAALTAVMPNAYQVIDNIAHDDHVMSLSCAPLGWTSIFESQQSACIASPARNLMTSAISAGSHASGVGGHHRAEPPWIQFDRDANDALIWGKQELLE